MPEGRLKLGPNHRTPFGQNEWLASTANDVNYESVTVANGAVPSETIDGHAQKVLQPGTIMARITSGDDEDKVGVFDTQATDGRQTKVNIVGICDTFVPWTLNERDVDIRVAYGTCWGDIKHIFGYDTTKKTLEALEGDNVVEFTDFQTPFLDIRFRTRYTESNGTEYGSFQP